MSNWFRSRAWVLFSLATLVVATMAAPASAVAVRAPAYRADALAQPGRASVEAGQLARRLSNSKPGRSRIQALDAILRALDISVYNGTTGRIVVPGSARSAGDLYLYTYEVALMADAYSRRQTGTLQQVTDALNNGGYRQAGDPLTAAALGAALGGSVRAAVLDGGRSPQDLMPLLIQAIGRHDHPAHDPAKQPLKASTRLDSLQMFLITAALIYPPVLAARAPKAPASQAAGRALTAETDGAFVLAEPSSGPCDFQVGSGFNAEKWAGKALAKNQIFKFIEKRFGKKVKEIGEHSLEILEKLIEALNGLVSAYGVQVTADPSSGTQQTELGRPGAPGKPLAFAVKVVMRDEIPEKLIECGELIGIEIPRKGPIPGVFVAWNVLDLRKWGKIMCPDAGCLSTADDGVATLRFQPKDDKPPFAGLLQHHHGQMEVVPAANSKVSSYLGLIGDMVRNVGFDYEIAYHDTPQATLAYQATIMGSDSCTNDPACVSGSGGTATSDDTYSGRLAGTVDVPLADSATGAGTASESGVSYRRDWSAQNVAIHGICPVDAGGGAFEPITGTSTASSTGTTNPGPLNVVSLTVNGMHDANGHLISASDVQLTYALTDDAGNMASANTTITTTITAPARCADSSTSMGTTNMGWNIVYSVHNARNQVNPDGIGISLPTKDWTVSKTWTPEKGGTLATAHVTTTFSGTQGATKWAYSVTESLTLSTQPDTGP